MKALDFNEMENVNGGMLQGEYCKLIYSLFLANEATWSDAEMFNYRSASAAHCS